MIDCRECRCDPHLCADDDTGQHCEIRACGPCQHGCPAPDDTTCCQAARPVDTIALPGVSH